MGLAFSKILWQQQGRCLEEGSPRPERRLTVASSNGNGENGMELRYMGCRMTGGDVKNDFWFLPYAQIEDNLLLSFCTSNWPSIVFFFLLHKL